MRKWVSSEAHRTAVQILREQRELKGLSLRAVSERLGKKHHTYLHKIETGERSLDLIDFVAIARAMGVDERALFDELLSRLPAHIDV